MPLTRGRYKLTNSDWLRAGSPAGTFAESCPKILAAGDLAIAATGVELAVGVPLDSGDVVTSVTFVVGATALATGTAGYVVLREPTGAKLAQTADFTNTARAANTAYTVSLTAPYTIPAGGLYRIGISFTASTIPTLRGVSLGNAAVTAVGTTIAVTHGSAVGGTAPSTVATPSNAAVLPYLLVS